MKRFALIGAAGYIAKRHMRAIKETGNQLVCASDRFDVMGCMDSYFPEAEFFLEHENLDRFMDDQRMAGTPIDYVSICTPNYMHPTHIRFALRNGANAICEKPMVIHPDEMRIIKDIEAETGKRVYTILQLRHHPAILDLKRKVDLAGKDKFYKIDLNYITTRGKWYFKSWKGDVQKSGGIATNIGIHLFDMLIWIFGSVRDCKVNIYRPFKAVGTLKLENAEVNWHLSLDESDLPDQVKLGGKRTFRSMIVNDEEIDFTDGFTDLHTESYRHILAGNGFGVEDVRESIQLTEEIRDFG
nr:Gfo/Idh/MocA family oxidoreductase [uncultured Draconibacterium sp.]